MVQDGEDILCLRRFKAMKESGEEIEQDHGCAKNGETDHVPGRAFIHGEEDEHDECRDTQDQADSMGDGVGYLFLPV